MKLNNCKVDRTLIYHKTKDEICTNDDPNHRPTVFKYLPNLKYSKWIMVGRLDINTSGLLLFTTDGELAYRLMHPKYKIEREYMVRIFGKLNAIKISKLLKGIKLECGVASFHKLYIKKSKTLNRWCNITLLEGKNREIRRLFESVEVKVNRIIRIRYCDLFLPKWLPGKNWIELPLDKINILRKKVKLPLIK